MTGVPQLSISVYSPTREDELFRLVCEVVGVVEWLDVLPTGLEFEAIGDVADRVSPVEPPPGADAWAALGDERRPVTAYLAADGLGPVVVEFERAVDGDRHAVAALLDAGALGLPGERRSAAMALGGRARELLRAVCEYGDVLYGEVAVEHTLPTPSRLINNGWGLRDAVFLSHTVADPDSSFVRKIRDTYGEDVVEEWETGVFLCGWAPFSTTGLEVEHPDLLFDEVSRYLANRLRFLR